MITQVQDTLAVLPGPVNVTVTVFPQLPAGMMNVTCSLPLAAMVLPLACTVTPLMLEPDDHVSALALELLISVTVQVLLPFSLLVQGCELASTLVGVTERVGAACTTRVTLTVALCEPTLKVIVAW